MSVLSVALFGVFFISNKNSNILLVSAYKKQYFMKFEINLNYEFLIGNDFL